MAWAVKDWDQTFEDAGSRKVSELNYLGRFPIDLNSRAFRRLMKSPAGCMAHAHFIGIVQVAARCTTRGILVRDGVPLTIEEIAEEIRTPLALFKKSWAILTAAECGWLIGTETPTRAQPDPNATPVEHQSVPTTPPSIARQEKEREKDNTKERIPKRESGETAADPPGVLSTPEFVAVWAEYADYRRERGLRALSPRSVKAKWDELAGWGHERAVAAVRQTIANGWQGIFEPKENGHGTRNGSANGTHRPDPAAARRSERAKHEYDEPDLKPPVYRSPTAHPRPVP